MDVRTPLVAAPALALGNRIFRKQVLKVGDLHYQGGTFPITPAYLDQVVDAFDARAIPSVPFQLADHANRHTEDPERRRGTIRSLHRTPNGLDAVIELNDAAAAIVDDDPEFGVSVLIKHDRTTGEGRKFPAVLAHVLGTTDPVLAELGPWKPELAASNDTGPVLDLLALTSAPHTDTTAPKEAPMAEADALTTEEMAQLRSLLPKLATLTVEPTTADAPPAEVTPKPAAPAADEGDSDEDEFTPEEIAAMAATIDHDDPDLIAASHTEDGGQPSEEVLGLTRQLALAQQASRDQELRLAQLEGERNTARYLAEREHLAREFGVLPRITDIVRPLLEGTGGEIALSNGGTVNAAELVRKFVKELSAAPRLDLSQPAGTSVDHGEDDGEAEQRDALAKVALAQLNQ